jgi:uncharacterized lipoprotein YajG
MRILTLLTATLAIAACTSTPQKEESRQQELATERFEKCMDATLPTFVHVTIATADQRLRAAEVCKSVMSQGAPEKDH